MRASRAIADGCEPSRELYYHSLYSPRAMRRAENPFVASTAYYCRSTRYWSRGNLNNMVHSATVIRGWGNNGPLLPVRRETVFIGAVGGIADV